MEELMGRAGVVTTTIPAHGMGEVRLAVRGGSETFGAYAVDRDQPIPTGTRVVVFDVFPPRTIVVLPQP